LLELFKSSSCKTKSYPVVGMATVYMKRDENMGKCLIHNSNFVTPNMPKLHYASDFVVQEERLILKNINPSAKFFKKAYVFEKRDGFNCLFYLYKNRVIPKTRLSPIASGKIQEIVKLREFPMENIEEMVRDGFVPVFEIWGTKLAEYDIMHGSVDVRLVQSLEELPELNTDLVAVMKADYEKFNYHFLSPTTMMKLAKEYNVNHIKFHGMIEISMESINDLMYEAEKRNATVTIREGYVLHCYDGQKYKMFKVKPLSLMQKDVLSSKRTIAKERIQLEISKVLVETDVMEIAKNPVEYLKDVVDYLSEDYKVTNRIRKKVNEVFIDEVAREFAKKYPQYKTEPWQVGVHRMFLGKIKSL